MRNSLLLVIFCAISSVGLSAPRRAIFQEDWTATITQSPNAPQWAISEAWGTDTDNPVLTLDVSSITPMDVSVGVRVWLARRSLAPAYRIEADGYISEAFGWEWIEGFDGSYSTSSSVSYTLDDQSGALKAAGGICYQFKFFCRYMEDGVIRQIGPFVTTVTRSEYENYDDTPPSVSFVGATAFHWQVIYDRYVVYLGCIDGSDDLWGDRIGARVVVDDGQQMIYGNWQDLKGSFGAGNAAVECGNLDGHAYVQFRDGSGNVTGLMDACDLQWDCHCGFDGTNAIVESSCARGYSISGGTGGIDAEVLIEGCCENSVTISLRYRLSPDGSWVEDDPQSQVSAAWKIYVASGTYDLQYGLSDKDHPVTWYDIGQVVVP